MATSKYTNGASYTISKGTQTYPGDYLKVFRGKKHHVEIYLRAVKPTLNDGGLSQREQSFL